MLGFVWYLSSLVTIVSAPPGLFPQADSSEQ